MIDVSHPFFDTNLSWLSYNYRLLLEAEDETVPPVERLRHLAHYSYQTDEFFRDRVPLLSALREVSKDVLDKLNIYPDHLLEHILETVDNQLTKFDELLTGRVIPALRERGVHLYFKEPFKDEHREFVRQCFVDKIFRHVQPVFLDGRRSAKITLFEPNTLYFILRLARRGEPGESWFAYVNIPVAEVGRFVKLPKLDKNKHVAFLDDLVVANMGMLFPGYEVQDCFAIRPERETQLDIEDEYPTTLAQRISRQLEKKNFLPPQSYFYEMGMPADMRETL